MAPWVKKLTAAAWVFAKVRVRSPAQGSELKVPVMSRLRSLAWGHPCVAGAAVKWKKKKKKRKILSSPS